MLIPMPAFLTLHNVTSMKIKIILLSAVTIFLSNVLNAQDAPLYSFVAKVFNPQDTSITFTYKNKSQFPQCIRAEDLDVNLNLFADALYVTSTKGEPIKYIGPHELSLSLTPKNFIIIPPGQEALGGIFLDKYYDAKKENVIVSYSIPVIPCQIVLEKYINIPFTDFIKDKIHNPTVEKTDAYAYYPEWTQYGFIAVSNPLLIERSKK
jgi:hypothetical protein